uniref:Uncharacterized protein n=1 Tax=Cacopsylla melanoneura TaxID=428564 RepID=A0A8D8ZEM7_9HEMI
MLPSVLLFPFYSFPFPLVRILSFPFSAPDSVFCFFFTLWPLLSFSIHPSLFLFPSLSLFLSPPLFCPLSRSSLLSPLSFFLVILLFFLYSFPIFSPSVSTTIYYFPYSLHSESASFFFFSSPLSVLLSFPCVNFFHHVVLVFFVLV